LVIPCDTKLLLIYISYGALGNDGAVAITLTILFFSIPPAIGEMSVIVSAAVVSVVVPTITVFCHSMVSLMISETLMVNVHDFLIASPLENNLTP